MDIPEIDLKDYNYHLPEKRIAQYPLESRDASKLLVYSGKTITHANFRKLGEYLPSGCTLVFNNTRVIPARLYFQKPTGAEIEIFLLHPISPSPDINIAMLATRSSSWSCMIGNQKRWKPGQPLKLNVRVAAQEVQLTATQIENGQVRFNWSPSQIPFVEVIKQAGQVPLPPYMKRASGEDDRRRYQTVYSKSHGAVAAPTAGLHFTDSILESLESQGINKEYLTLHVGAGTFLPIKTTSVVDHPMHGEQISITSDHLDHLIKADNLIAVGTTSLRTLESLYWYGVKMLNNLGEEFYIEKLAPYRRYKKIPGFKESLQLVRSYLQQKDLASINGYTEIFIFPPYRVKSVTGLITNFHLPASTLILLVAAFIGKEWKQVYQQALDHNYRFLSYGDSSLLLPS